MPENTGCFKPLDILYKKMQLKVGPDGPVGPVGPVGPMEQESGNLWSQVVW